MYIIYRVTNKINNKIYVGFTEKSLSDRKKCHKHSALKKGLELPFYRAIRKHGFENFEWTVLEKGEGTREFGLERERHFIESYNSTDTKLGYNATSGGDGLSSRDFKIIQKIKESTIKYFESEDFSRVKHSRARGGKAIEVYKAVCIRKGCGRPNPRPSVYEKGELVEKFETQRDACDKLDLHPSKVNSCLKGNRKQHKGYIFEVVE